METSQQDTPRLTGLQREELLRDAERDFVRGAKKLQQAGFVVLRPVAESAFLLVKEIEEIAQATRAKRQRR